MAAVFAYVGGILLQRPTPHEDGRVALRLFATWWLALAVLFGGQSVATILAAAGVVSLPLHVALALVNLVPLTVGLWGLLYYLLYIYTGRASLLRPLTVAYLLLFVWYVYLVVSLGPTGVDVGTWQVELHYARADDLDGPLGFLAIATLLVPILVAAALYGTLYFRTHDAETRYRIATVSSAFLVWFGSAAVAPFVRVGDAPLADAAAWPLVSRLIGLGAALLVLAAYRPPRVVRERLGLDDLPPRGGAPRPPRPRFAPAFSRLARSAMTAASSGASPSSARAARRT